MKTSLLQIKNAADTVFIGDIIKINPTRCYLAKEAKKQPERGLLCPEGYLIVDVLNRKKSIPKGADGELKLMDVGKTVLYG